MPSLLDNLEAWLAVNRSRRCKLLTAACLDPEAGDVGTLELKMLAGSKADLDYIRSGKDTPSSISSFRVEVRAVAGEKLSHWSGDVLRTMDDVAGSPRVQLQYGPLTRSGDHFLFVSLGGKQIAGCPYRIKVLPRAKTYAGASSLHDAGGSTIATHLRPPSPAVPSPPSSAADGTEGDAASPPERRSPPPPPPLSPLPPLTLHSCEEADALIVARDRYGNRRDAGGDTFFVTVARQAAATSRTKDDDVDGSSDYVSIDDRGDGAYRVRFSRARVGEYVLRAFFQGGAVRGCLPIRVLPGALDIQRCDAAGDGLHEALAAQSARFTITARDAVGNVVTGGGVRWLVLIEARGDDSMDASDGLLTAAAEAQASAVVTDAKDGTYHVGYTVPRAGRFLLHVVMGDAQPAASGRTTVREGRLVLPGSPYALTVRPSADDPSCVVVDLKSGLRRANLDDGGGDGVQPVAELEAGEVSEVQMRVVGLERSTDAQAEHALLSQIGVRIERASSCGGGGDGTAPSTDASAEGAERGGANLVSAAHGARILSCAPHGGRLKIAFAAIDASGGGEYCMHVALAGRALASSPVRFRIRPAATDPGRCRLAPRPLAIGESHAALVGPQPGVAGADADDLPGSPSSVVIGDIETVAMARERVRGPGGPRPLVAMAANGTIVTKGELEVDAGTPAALTLTACDKYGNRKDVGGDPFAVHVTPCAHGGGGGGGSHTDPGPCDVHDNGDGTYAVAFTRYTAGVYVARLFLHGEPVPGRVLCRVRPTRLDLARCDAAGDGLSGHAVAGVPSRFHLRARDAWGNQLEHGGLHWRVNVDRVAVPPASSGAAATDALAEVLATAVATVTDQGDGSYLAEYVVPERGRYRISIDLAISPAHGIYERLEAGPFDIDALPNFAIGEGVHMACSWLAVGVDRGAARSAPLVAGEAARVELHSADDAAPIPAATTYRASVELIEDGSDGDDGGGGATQAVPVPVERLYRRATTADGDHAATVGAAADDAPLVPFYELSFVAQLASERYCLRIGAVGRHGVVTPLKGTPIFFGVDPARPDASRCELAMLPAHQDDGSALRVGAKGRLRLLLRDAFGNATRCVDEASISRDIRVALYAVSDATEEGEEGGTTHTSIPCTLSVEAAVTRATSEGREAGDAIEACFVPPRVGTYIARAHVHGRSVPSAVVCTVRPGAFCLSASDVSGDGVRSAVAGVLACFRILARDVCANQLDCGGLVWRVLIRPDASGGGDGVGWGRPAKVTVADLCDGSYAVDYTVDRAGRYEVQVWLADGAQAAPSAPRELLYRGTIEAAPAPLSPSACTADVPDTVAAGEYAIARVYAADGLGNALPAAALGGTLRACLEWCGDARGQPKAPVDAERAAAGAQVLTGDAARHIAEAAWDPSAAGAAAIPPTLAAVGALSGAEVGEAAYVAFRATVAGSYRLDLSLSAGEAATAAAGSRLHGGPFDVDVTPAKTLPSRSTLAMHKGVPPAPGEAPPTATTMAAASDGSVSLEEGEAAYAWLTVADRFGNPRHTGGDYVRLLYRTSSRVAVAEVTDHRNGTYACRISPELGASGALELSLAVNGVVVPLGSSRSQPLN